MTRGMKRLLLIWGVFVALAAIIYAHQRGGGTESGATSGPKWLLPVTYAELGSIEIMHSTGLHRFERDSEGHWFYHGLHGGENADHEHRVDPELSNTISDAVAMFTRAQREQNVPLQDSGDDYGLVKPELVILAYRPQATEPVLRLAVGSVAPDGYARYVLPLGASEAVTIPNYQVTNLLSMIEAAGKSMAMPTSAVN
jgi:hypothetical protein